MFSSSPTLRRVLVQSSKRSRSASGLRKQAVVSNRAAPSFSTPQPRKYTAPAGIPELKLCESKVTTSARSITQKQRLRPVTSSSRATISSSRSLMTTSSSRTSTRITSSSGSSSNHSKTTPSVFHWVGRHRPFGVRQYSVGDTPVTSKPRKLLACVDGSELSQRALAEAVDLARPQDTILVLCVPPLVQAPAGLGEEFENALIQERDAAVNRVIEQAEGVVKGANCAYTTIIGAPSGGPRLEILRVAEEQKADYIVVGSRGMGAIQRALLGSTSNYVVHHAPCNVIVVHN